MPLDYRNRSYIKEKDPKLAEAFEDILRHISDLMSNTNNVPGGSTNPPPDITSLSVVASNGVFDVAILDNTSSISRGINYFLEYSLSPSFTAPIVLDLGSSRNWRGFLGNQILYFRAYSSYPTSSRSSPVYFGSQSSPTAVVGGGTISGPAPQASNGSGTSKGANGSDGGFGNIRTRGGAFSL